MNGCGRNGFLRVAASSNPVVNTDASLLLTGYFVRLHATTIPDNKDLLELYKQHQAGQDKYTYFLLAAAGAAIGFVVQKAEGLTLSWWLVPAAAPTLCWGVSFYFGCKNLTWVQITTYANYSALQLKAGIHPDQPPHPQLTEIAISGVESAIDKNTRKAQFYGIWQFRMLVTGATFFIGWRVAEMVRLTYGT